MKPFLFWIALLCASAQVLPAQISSNITLIGQWSDSTIVSPFPMVYNEVWGFVQDGREYAAMGSNDGVYIINIDDPVNPAMADYIPRPATSHRDMHDFRGYLYMVAEWTSSFGIADLSYLPDSVHLVYDSNELFESAHNIFIDSSRARLYAFGSQDTNFTTMDPVARVISLANPTQPQVIGGFDFQGYAHDGYVRDDTAFINMWDEGVVMVDFTDPQNPTPIGQLPVYGGTGFVANHSGWLSPDKETYVFADEWIGAEIKALDVTDPGNIQIRSSFQGVTDPDSITPHNVMFDGRYLFIACYTDGLRVFDLIDPQNPVLTGFYDTFPGVNLDNGFNGAWGIYSYLPSGRILVSDRETGLYIFDVSQAVNREDPRVQTLEIWPVPARDRVKLRIPEDGTEWERVRVYNLQGKIIFEEEIGNKEGNDLEMQLKELDKSLNIVELIGKQGESRIGKIVRQ